MKDSHNDHPPRLWTPLEENFGLNPKVAMLVVFSSILLLALAVFWFFYSAPPTTITITSGPPGSSFATNASQYAVILARSGVKLKILPSLGSAENLDRLNDRRQSVDVGFVLVGPTNEVDGSDLMSLGSIAYQPLLLFYRSAAPVTLLSEFNGKRVAIGSQGSGTRSLAVSLLDLNGIGTNGSTAMFDLDAAAAADALISGSLDAVFMMGDSASRRRSCDDYCSIPVSDFTTLPRLMAMCAAFLISTSLRFPWVPLILAKIFHPRMYR